MVRGNGTIRGIASSFLNTEDRHSHNKLKKIYRQKRRLVPKSQKYTSPYLLTRCYLYIFYGLQKPMGHIPPSPLLYFQCPSLIYVSCRSEPSAVRQQIRQTHWPVGFFPPKHLKDS